jgi:hypothetical protein
LAGHGGAAGLPAAAATRRVVYDGRAVTVRFGK